MSSGASLAFPTYVFLPGMPCKGTLMPERQVEESDTPMIDAYVLLKTFPACRTGPRASPASSCYRGEHLILMGSPLSASEFCWTHIYQSLSPIQETQASKTRLWLPLAYLLHSCPVQIRGCPPAQISNTPKLQNLQNSKNESWLHSHLMQQETPVCYPVGVQCGLSDVYICLILRFAITWTFNSP